LKLLIIDNYDSFTYNLVQLVEEAGQTDNVIIKNDRLDGIISADFDKVLISPGPGIACETGQLPEFIARYYTSKSFLGVCLGFEALLEFFGGHLKQLSEPMHGIQNKGFVVKRDLLFRGLEKPFLIGHYHSWVAIPDDFPVELEVSVKDDMDQIMAFHHKQYDLYGVQFHPESFMTPQGCKMIANWLNFS